MKTNYGVISDIHRAHPKNVEQAFQELKRRAVQAIVLNGDIVGDQFYILDPLDYFTHVLTYAADADLETYILPGSHEEVAQLEPVVKAFQGKYKNLVYTVEEPKIEKPDHHLVFLPGSDWRAGLAVESGFMLERTSNPSGLYRNGNKGLIRVINMNDLKKLVTDPEKTVLFSHVPRKFYNVETGFDMALFGEATLDFPLQGHFVEKGSVFPGPVAYKLKEQGLPVRIKNEDRGNRDLEEIMKELGIKKQVTGHFHESAQRAHDLKCNPVEQGNFTDELFWMASYLDGLKVGILTVDGNKVSYENIDLN